MSKPVWRTAIGDPQDEHVYVRGYDLEDLARNLSFAGMVYLTLTGELPNREQERMIDCLLVSVVDHGISPSSTVTRFLAASGVPLQVAIGGGVLSVGDVYGGACEELAQLLTEGVRLDESERRAFAETLVDDRLQSGHKVPGYGHPQHRAGDPRAATMLDVSHETGVFGAHSELAMEVERVLMDRKGPGLKINNDGSIAATICDLGLPWQAARAFVVVPRTVGLTAHALEEVDREPGWRHIPLDEVTYDGPPPRAYPSSRG